MYLLFLLLLVLRISKGLHLAGTDQSYAQFSKWYISVNSSLELEFRTVSKEGLLLYTDDGGYYDFLEVKLVEERLRVRFNLGGGAETLNIGESLADGAWHTLKLTFLGSLTSLALDNHIASRISKGKEFYLGNFTTNSYLYIGGLPPWYKKQLANLALPSVVFEPRYSGEVRNLIYAGDQFGRPRNQDMMAYKDVRLTSQDHCRLKNPCLNSGLCLSTDQGSVCNCRGTRFTGIFCEKGLPDDELSVWGNGYLALDLGRVGHLSPPLLAEQDNITLSFKTEAKDGIIFFSAYSGDYMSLYLSKGEIRLDLRIGTGRLKTGVSKKRFNDNEWHTVIIHRRAVKVTLEVDRTHRERWTSPGIYNLLASTYVYVGGVPDKLTHVHYRPHNYANILPSANFIGCIKNVELRADSVHIYLIQLGKEKNSLVSANGQLEFKCNAHFAREIQHDVLLTRFYDETSSGAVTFTRPQAFLRIPGFGDERHSQISLRIRTLEHNGILLYSPGQGGHFFGIEEFASHLYLHYNLGTGHVKMRISGSRVDDGQWHLLQMTRRGGEGNISLDSQSQTFKIPGNQRDLKLMEYMYLAGLPPFQVPHPPQVWSASLGLGFVGCVRDLIIQGFPVQLNELAEEQDSGSVKPSCNTPKRSCKETSCEHLGVCLEGWHRYSCDCTNTGYTGPSCNRESSTIQMTGYEDMKVLASAQSDIEADDISVRFRTVEPSGVIFSTSDDWSSDRLEIALSRGGLVLTVRMDGHESVMLSGFGLDNGNWHTVHVVRHGRQVLLEIDGASQRSETLMSSTPILKRARYSIGSGIASSQSYPNFSGSIQQVIVNGRNLVELERNQLLSNSELTARFKLNIEVPFHPITFASEQSFLGLPQLKTYYDLNIRFMFKTKERYGLLLYNGGKHSDFIVLELMDGHVHLLLSIDRKSVELKDNNPISVSDNQWHTLTISRIDLDTVVLSLDDSSSRVETGLSNSSLQLDGLLFLGGVRAEMFPELPAGVFSKNGFKGCLASLEFAGETVEALESAVLPSSDINQGCEEERVECRDDTCGNLGTCRSRPTPTKICNCDLTSFTGPKCLDESVSFEWREKTGLIKYEYTIGRFERMDGDVFALGLITPLPDSVILRIDHKNDNTYLELTLADGKVVVTFYSEKKEIVVRENSQKVNDGKYHVVRFSKIDNHALLQVDDYQVKSVVPTTATRRNPGGAVKLQIGGKWNQLLGQVQRPFQGVLAGIVYNGVRPLDLVKQRKGGAVLMGDVRLLKQIPFNYRERNLDLFERMQQTDSSSAPGVQDDIIIPKCTSRRKNLNSKCYQYSGSGDELITPVYNSPRLEVSTTWTHPCLDDEDCWQMVAEGSGVNVEQETTTIHPYISATFSTFEEATYPESTEYHYETYSPIYPSLYYTTPQGGRMEESPPGGGRSSYENYDQKYNIYESPEEMDPETNPRERVKVTNLTGTLLVIGIICVVLSAVILIIVIVMKMRTNTDSVAKVPESKTFLPEETDANVFAAKPVKTNSSKPVKEWYV